MENSNEILRKDYENDLIEVWQKFTLTPKPDLHGKILNCSYIQVILLDSTLNISTSDSSNYQRDQTGKALFQSSVDVEILVHYLAALHDDGPAVIPADASGQHINIRWKHLIN